MSFKFEFKIDYDKLTALLDNFLKNNSDELTSIMGKCLVLQPSSSTTTSPSPPPPPPVSIPTPPVPESPPPKSNPILECEAQAPDLVVDKRPLIGDDIPEDPFQNLFPTTNPNITPTRFQDRNPNNPHIKKGFR